MRSLPFKLMLALVYILSCALTSCSQQPVYSPPPQIGPDVIIETSQLRPKTPLFFTYRHGRRNINFFVMELGGKVQSFFDACMTCYPKKKGYRSDNDTVVCRACNRSFSVYTLEKGVGGCYPIKLSGREKGGKYIIAVSAIEAQADKF